MTKTLADMTAEERANCVGMWSLIEGINLAVISEADETNACVVIYPQWEGDSAVHLNEIVTPRHDLPRAWTSDGEPVPLGKVQRLQAAVQEMLLELNIYQEQENEQRIHKEPLDTIETYGLTKEDME